MPDIVFPLEGGGAMKGEVMKGRGDEGGGAMKGEGRRICPTSAGGKAIKV